jgi:hypothetical protein
MRTARRVIVCLLILSAAAGLHAQQSTAPSSGSVDTDVTVTGRDDAIIPIPDPEEIDEEPSLPALDSDQPSPYLVPPVQPPIADSAPSEASPKGRSGAP